MIERFDKTNPLFSTFEGHIVFDDRWSPNRTHNKQPGHDPNRSRSCSKLLQVTNYRQGGKMSIKSDDQRKNLDPEISIE
jgi:hypothetical protein